MDQDSHKWTFLFPTVVPLFSRNRGPIAVAETRRAAAAIDVSAIQAQAIGAIDCALAAYRAALDKLSTAEQMLGDVRTTEETARRQLAAGDISQLDLGVVQVELVSRELARHDALVRAQEAFGLIEDAMQRPADLPENPLPPADPPLIPLGNVP
jgi:outer membrane protein TolC